MDTSLCFNVAAIVNKADAVNDESTGFQVLVRPPPKLIFVSSGIPGMARVYLSIGTR